jgi:hypothetical protein
MGEPKNPAPAARKQSVFCLAAVTFSGYRPGGRKQILSILLILSDKKFLLLAWESNTFIRQDLQDLQDFGFQLPPDG